MRLKPASRVKYRRGITLSCFCFRSVSIGKPFHQWNSFIWTQVSQSCMELHDEVAESRVYAASVSMCSRQRVMFVVELVKALLPY